MAQLEITRGGKFFAKHMINTSKKCGAMSNRSYEYFVRICATDHKLTPEGFIINNEYIQEFFNRRFGKLARPYHAKSCEHLAIQAARELAYLVKLGGVVCQMVEVTIRGSNGARIMYRWEEGDASGHNCGISGCGETEETK
jgi:hypothetical protein